MRPNQIKAWYAPNPNQHLNDIRSGEPITIFKKSVLKTGYRAFLAIDIEDTQPEWLQQFLLEDLTLFYIDGSGFYSLANIDLSDGELYFAKYNLPVGFQPWIFYSWQSDYNTSRNNITEALNRCIDHINTNRNPRSSISVVSATRQEDGADDIVQAIKRNIDRSLMCVFDITNVAQTPDADPPRWHPNANVSYELGYALNRKRRDQIIIIQRTRNGEGSNTTCPFDFAHHRRLNYTRPQQLRQDLPEIITAYLERISFIPIAR